MSTLARSWREQIAGLLSFALATAGSVLAVAVPAQAAPPCRTVAPTEQAAAAMAASCGSDVVIQSTQSEYAQVKALANGRMVFESAVVPQRAKQADGSWADIDLTLVRGAGGLLRPRISIADIALSPGGEMPMVTVRRAGKTFTMSWPRKLPTPTVAGDTATYANVLSDVDLVVRATRTGFTHVLVVKTPAAAAAVGQIEFALGGDAVVSRAADGSLRATAGDTVITRAKPALMWDSSMPVTLSGQDLTASSARGAGDTARVRPVGAEVTNGKLLLRPHHELLSAPASAYPMYVDPNWEYGSASGQKWAYATSNNTNNTDYSVARVGKRPDGDRAVYRSFFEFPTSSNGISLKGKYIHNAHVDMHLTHSSSCSNQYTYMYLTPAINATMKASWSSMTLSTYMGAQYGHANEAGGCGVIQPDMPDMIFASSTFTSQVQTAATGNWNTLTVGFAARDTSGGGESTSDRWMKYIPDNSILYAEYDSLPGQPNGLQVAGVACPTGIMTVGTLTPNLSAVYPDADTTQTLSGSYEWIEAPSGGVNGDTLRISRNTSTTGTPTKSPSERISAGWGTVGNFMTTDYDNDGKDDILGLNGGDQLMLWRSTSTSSNFGITSAYDFGTTWSTFSKWLPPGDFDGDGKPEIAGFGATGDELWIHRNASTSGNPVKGAGGFVSSGWKTVTGFMVTDVDRDGKDDILGLNGDSLLVWRSLSTGTAFSFAAYHSFGSGFSSYSKFLTPADFDGDGKPDIAAWTADKDKLYIYRNKSTSGAPSLAPAYLVSSGWATVGNQQATDYDGDGKADVIGYNGTDQLLVWLSTSTATTFGVTSFFNFGTGWSAYGQLFPPADFDGNGKADIAGIDRTKATDTFPSRLSPTLTASASANGRGTTGALPTLTKDKVYAYRVRTTDPAPYNKVSAWSAWCSFTVDTSVPNVSVSVVSAPAGPGKPGTFRISSTSPDVTKFKYGWGAATTEVAASGSPLSATVTLTAPKFGQNILHVSAVDATLNEGFGSAEFSVGRPSPAVAQWGLEIYPGTDKAAALADRQPALSGNTPLTAATHVAWRTDYRLTGGQTFSADGNNVNAARTTGSVVDTSKSFSVAMWSRPGTCTGGSDTIASAEGTRGSSFMLDRMCSGNYWRVATHAADVDNAAAVQIRSIKTVAEGRWQHLAMVYDAVEKQIRLYIDGTLQASATTSGIFNAGSFVLGSAKWNGAQGQTYHGEIADAQVFDRVLVANDFTGMRADDPSSGGFNEPGILSPVGTGSWDFSAGTSCWTANVKDTCESPDTSAWGRWLSLSRGAEIGAGHSNSDSGLWIDTQSIPDENGNSETVPQEYAVAAYKTGTTPPDANDIEYTTWQTTRALRTDWSFTVSAWVALGEAPAGGNRTVLSQDGTKASGFYLGTRVSNNQHYWAFMMSDTDANDANTRWAGSRNPVTNADVGTWAHLVGVYDMERGELRLYLNGELQNVTARPNTYFWQAAGALTVGRAKWNGVIGDGFRGGVDEITLYQGAMTDAAVAALYATQS